MIKTMQKLGLLLSLCLTLLISNTGWTLEGIVPAPTSDTPSASGGIKPSGFSNLFGNGEQASGVVDFLPVEQAFIPTVGLMDDHTLLVQWYIEKGYYLYRNKLTFQAPPQSTLLLDKPKFPIGKIKNDEFFGKMEIYNHSIEVQIPVLNMPASGIFDLQLNYQGCAEAGICYPPETKTLSINVADAYLKHSSQYQDTAKILEANAAPASALAPEKLSEQDRVTQLLQESNLLWIVLSMFALGILLAFTACMYPMIPILSSIIAGEGTKITTLRAFTLSVVYVESVAVVFAGLGILSATLGAGVQAWFQHPAVIAGFAAIFVALALSMFGFFHIQMPSALQSKLNDLSNNQRGGSLIGVALMGMLSALIVGPCAGPVLVGALAYISQTGNEFLGAIALFSLANGMGLPLVIIGTTEGTLLPKAGAWMDSVKHVFGVIMLAVANLMLERILPGAVSLLLWALLLIITAIYMGALEKLPDVSTGWRKLQKGLAISMLIYGSAAMIGSASGGHDILNPLKSLSTPASVATGSGEHLVFKRIKTLDDFDRELAAAKANGQTLMLDFYADWCTYCIKMEDYTFSDAKVKAVLADTILIQADVTHNDQDDKALLNHFNLYAPPAILLFNTKGEELADFRVVGFKDAGDFVTHLNQAWAK